MDYLIIYDDEPIGTLIEPKADFMQGIVGGRFIPLAAYKKIQSVFRAYAQVVSAELKSGQRNEKSMSSYRQQLDALTSKFSIKTLEGLPVETTGIDIDDFSEQLEAEGYEAHFVVATHEFFDNIFLWNPREAKEN
jgi:hypothetical protein